MPFTFPRRLSTIVAAAAITALAPLSAAQAATVVNLEHDAVGTTHMARTNSDITLGPSVLHTDLDIDTFDFTGSLPLPGTTTEFKALGLLPVTADVSFVEAAPLEGHISLGGMSATVTSTAKYHVKLSNIEIAGFPTFTGSWCRTVNPVTIPANTPAGESFDIMNGGHLTGTYSIGLFQHCGTNTWLINLLVPGGGNTLDLTVSNGRLAS